MSSSLPLASSSSAYESSNAAPGNGVRTWWREPLLHFVLLGAVLFAADHFFISRANDPHTIVIGAEVDKEAIDVFKASAIASRRMKN
jgi:hypothetical protein